MGIPKSEWDYLVFDQYWKAPELHYGYQRLVTDATISCFFSIKRPGKSVKEIQEHLTELRNKGTNVLALRLTVEQLLLYFYLLQIPGQVRGNL